MAKFSYAQNSFIAGEISEKAQARTDLELYKSACKKAENFIIYHTGSAGLRPGFEYAAETDGSGSEDAALIPFVVSDTEVYVLELTDQKIRVFDVNTMSFVHTISSTFSHGSLTVSSGYPASKIHEVNYAQRGPAIWLTHKDHYPQIIWKYGSSSSSFGILSYASPFSLLNINGSTFTIDYRAVPRQDVNVNASAAYQITPSALSGSITLTPGAADFFVAGYIGGIIRLQNPANPAQYLHCFVTAFNVGSPNTLTATVLSSSTWTATAAATTSYELPAFGLTEFSGGGFPRTVTFHEERTAFGGNNLYGNRIFLSNSTLHYVFEAADGSTDADEATKVVLADGRPTQINALVSERSLLAGGSYGPHAVAGVSGDNITFTAKTVKSQSGQGIGYVQGFQADSASILVDRSLQRILDVVYDFDSDKYNVSDLNYLSDHIAIKNYQGNLISATGYKRLCYQEADNSNIIWALNSAGTLISLTYNRKLNVVAFATHKIGGNSDSGNLYPGEVRSICSVPFINASSTVGGFDVVFAVIKRHINGSTKYYIEKMGRQFFGTHTFNASTFIFENPVYLDSSKIVNQVSSTTVTGFSHLIGETVGVLAHGKYLGTFVVDGSGNITLPVAVKRAIVGLPYVGYLEPVRPEAGSQIGSSQGSPKRIDRVAIRFIRTGHAKYGRDETRLYPVGFQQSGDIGDLYDLPDISNVAYGDLFSGDKVLEFPNGWDRDGFVVVKADLPLPCNVAAIYMRGVTHDG